MYNSKSLRIRIIENNVMEVRQTLREPSDCSIVLPDYKI